MVLVHGFGEHSRRYLDTVVPFFLQQGIAVIRYDHFGHGRSGGKRGHCSSYQALLELVTHAIALASGEYAGLPCFLYGHSLGGNLVLNQQLRSPGGVSALIASSPYLRLAFQPPSWKMLLGKALLHLYPSLTLDSGLDPGGISRIPEEVARYQNDPLVHRKVSPMFSFPVIAAGKWALAHAPDLNVPTLLLHGTADPIIDYRATQEFHAANRETTLELFDGGYHELHHDRCREDFFGRMLAWLDQQL